MPNDLPVWTPRLFKKQYDILNLYPKRTATNPDPEPPALLASGPRKSGKTIGLSHKLCRHLWETPGARGCIVSKTKSSAKDGGVWVDVLDAIEEWTSGEFGFEYTTKNAANEPGPKSDVVTKTDYFRVRNMYGGESSCMLFSLDHDRDVEAKLKSTRFSFIWFSELSLFLSPNVFRTSWQQLRMKHLRRDQHLWVADTNPSEEGEDAWQYKLWFVERIKLNHAFPDWQQGLQLIEIFLEDNPFLSPSEIQAQHALYADSPGDFDRLVKGLWTRGRGDQGLVFRDVFSPTIHIIGDAMGDDSIEVAKDATELIGGWDIGASVNHCAVLLENRVIDEVSYWMVLAELAKINEEIEVGDFTRLIMEKRDALDQRYHKEFGWKDWSDTTALNVFRANGDTYDYLTVRAASHGKIVLQGANKAEGAAKASVKLIRTLLRQNRLFAGANCPYISEMLSKLRYATSGSNLIEASKWRHGFDALRYPIFMESIMELEFGQDRIPKAVATVESVSVAF